MELITDYHAKYFSHEIGKRCSTDSIEKFSGILMDAQVDLNPHQIEAALFAFKSPLSSGAILADEVGLGKTIEAGLVISQKWAENSRRILIIVPASLRKQWSQELKEKFFLPSMILDAKSYNLALKTGVNNPFFNSEIVICSYQFAAYHSDGLMVVPWGLVVIDEAHRLRNVYKPNNKIARKLRAALVNSPKILLTATPLQNNLMELFGLVSFIDEHIFGDLQSFKSQYSRISTNEQFIGLKNRLKNLCHRTLRRQVLEYVKFTNRQAITQEFWPSKKEHELYEMVSEYLQRPELYALPNAQRKLMILIMRKLLASSTFAIAGTLDSLVKRLSGKLHDHKQSFKDLKWIDDDFELVSEYEDELSIVDTPEVPEDIDVESLEAEIKELELFRDLALSITENAKGIALIKALKAGFAKTNDLGAQNKAIIFTESRRTQDYLVNLLSDNGYEGKLVLFNGSNNDDLSKSIFAEWANRHQGSSLISGSKVADMRAALVDYFKQSAQIMIATEAASEGINLQFCSLVVNYDLPWNPQRIEQRIGRCHRYGQKHDVVVINFLNKANAADQRVFELLNEKFTLFDGVFGASDEVLGAIESGIDFENRIVEIYQTCREPQQIEIQFEELKVSMEDEISKVMNSTRRKLLENFDAEVHDRLKVNLRESTSYLDKYERLLWELTQYGLRDYASFNLDGFNGKHRFILNKNPVQNKHIPLGHYELGKSVDDAYIYRSGHPLALNIISTVSQMELTGAKLSFFYSRNNKKISSLEPLVGESGSLALYKLSIDCIDSADHLVFVGTTNAGELLEQSQMQRLFSLTANVKKNTKNTKNTKNFESEYGRRKKLLLSGMEERYSVYFDQEIDKLNNWAEDKRKVLTSELKDFDSDISELKKMIRVAKSLPEKIAYQRRLQKVEKQRDESWRKYDDQAKQIERDKDNLLDNIEEKLIMADRDQLLFAIEWSLV
jgi:superfamily II DNA or RNA helicase